MKNQFFIIIALVLFGFGSLQAQTDSLETAEAQPEQSRNEIQTLFSDRDGKTSHGFVGVMTFGYSEIDGNDAMISGGRAGWIINHGFVVGMHGYGFVNNINKEGTPGIGDYSLAGGYGGLFIEPIIAPMFPVHVNFPLQIGVGGISVTEGYAWDEPDNDGYYDTGLLLVAEPGVELEFNMVRFIRLSVGATYRFTNDVSLNYKYYDGSDYQTLRVPADALNGFTYNISVKFGWF